MSVARIDNNESRIHIHQDEEDQSVRLYVVVLLSLLANISNVAVVKEENRRERSSSERCSDGIRYVYLCKMVFIYGWTRVVCEIPSLTSIGKSRSSETTFRKFTSKISESLRED